MIKTKNKKVIVIGFDGATFDLIKPWVKQGELPNFARLMEEGVYGELQSTQPPISPQAWASFMTGMNAGKHGIYNFQEREPGSYNLRFINARSRNGKTLWRILSDAGKKVIVVGVPCTYPPEPVNGILISGFDCPSTKVTYTYPVNLPNEIEEVIGEYVIDVRIKSAFRKGNRDFLVEEIKSIEKKRFDLFFYFLKKYDWDFAIAVFMATDRAQHYFWKYMDPQHPLYDKKEALKYGNVILDVYKQGDYILGKILEKNNENISIVVMSDHGFGPGSTKVFYPNKWLRQEGFLHFKNDDSKNIALTKIGKEFKKMMYSLLRKTKNVMVKNLPRQIKESLMHRLPSTRSKLQSYLFFSQIDWGRTKAFSDEMWDAIWINVKGREPEGIVEPGADYEHCRNEIIEKLIQLKDNSTEEYVVDKVYKREELYYGPLTYKMPDLTFTLKDFKYRVRPSGASTEDSRQGVLGEITLEDRPSGSHRPKGIFILKGNEFNNSTELKNIHIMDLAPTILYLMGLPIPTNMDGKIITDAFKEACSPEFIEVDESIMQRSDVSPYNDEESEEIRKNLKQLGYME